MHCLYVIKANECDKQRQALHARLAGVADDAAYARSSQLAELLRPCFEGQQPLVFGGNHLSNTRRYLSNTCLLQQQSQLAVLHK